MSHFSRIKSNCIFFAMTAFFTLSACQSHAWRDGAGYLSLIDKLDRPEDGYCLDVAGSGNWVDLNVPLSMHNCKGPYFYADEAVIFNYKNGTIKFPAYNMCVTALGRDQRSLPKTPLILRACADDISSVQTPFNPLSLQTFLHRDDGRIELSGSGLCLTAGVTSDITFSPIHKWRALYLETCNSVSMNLSVWNRFHAR